MRNTEEFEVLVNQEIKKSITVSESESMSINEIKKVEESDESDLNGDESSKQNNEFLNEQDKLVLNNDMQLEDNEAHLKTVFNLKHDDFENIVMSELTEFLSEKSLQNIETPYLETKSVSDGHGQNKINLSETTKTNLMNEIKSEKYELDDDPLSTLASAALNQKFPTNVIINNDMLKLVSPVAKIQQEGPVWCDVGVIKDNTCLVKQFYATSISDEHENTSIDLLPDYQNKLKIDIEPGTTYKLRIAAINACGRGEWSDITAFKTCLPGYPGAPSSIRITKSSYGASLKWEAPPNNCGQILEYSVCLAIKKLNEGLPSLQTTAMASDFVRVYCGPDNAAMVSNESLSAALIDTTYKPAILFRIAARNEKGYGPATQVRWLQDTKASNKRDKVEDLFTFETKKPKF